MLERTLHNKCAVNRPCFIDARILAAPVVLLIISQLFRIICTVLFTNGFIKKKILFLCNCFLESITFFLFSDYATSRYVLDFLAERRDKVRLELTDMIRLDKSSEKDRAI